MDSAAVAQTRQTFEQRLFDVEDEDWKALLESRAPPEVERAVLSVLSRGFLAPVVGAREDLGPAGSFLTIRDLNDGTEHPSAVVAPAVLDVREARSEMDRWASLPGNLLPDAPPLLRRATLRIAKRALRPNLTANIAETERRRALAAAGVKDAVIQIKKGQKIIGDGELVTPDHLRMLAAMRAQTDRFDVFEASAGTAALVALLLAGIWTFHRRAFRRFRPTRRDGLLLGVLLLLFLGAFRLAAAVAEALHDRWPAVPLQALLVLLPIAAGAMLVRLLLNQELALFFGLVLSMLVGVMLGNSLFFAVYGLLGSLVAATQVARARDRAALFRSGVWVGLVNAGVVLAFALAAGKGPARDALLVAGFAGLGSALIVPTLVLALTPLLELGFGYASDLKLLELANLNHPALKELIVQSPGTYHHSIIVGSLVEAAAEATGCNPLLGRTCAYYHDIGKGKNPLYFGENQKGENPHDCLAPGMSAVIIKRHVTDGLDLAKRYKLPRAVQDVIAQHHGTRLVGYFHHRALKEAEGREGAVEDARLPLCRAQAAVPRGGAGHAGRRGGGREPGHARAHHRAAPGAGAADHHHRLHRGAARRVRPHPAGPERHRAVVPAHARGHLPLAAAVPSRGARRLASAVAGGRRRDAQRPAALLISPRRRGAARWRGAVAGSGPGR